MYNISVRSIVKVIPPLKVLRPCYLLFIIAATEIQAYYRPLPYFDLLYLDKMGKIIF
jgi:hypothetical protein